MKFSNPFSIRLEAKETVYHLGFASGSENGDRDLETIAK
jgi:hypothetical protein